MKHFYLFLSLLFTMLCQNSFGQSTTINTNLTGSTSTAGPTITFAVQNNNTYPIAINQILNYHNTVNNGVTYTLWYTSTQITGQPTITSPNWSVVGSGSAITLGSSAITPVITGLNFVIPANTIYRMAIVHSNTSGSVYYSSSGSLTYSGGGVDLVVGNNTTSPGYTGAFPTPGINGRWICGGIVFQPAAPPCPAPTGLSASSITNNSASLSWNAVTGSQGYEYVVDQTAANPSGAGTAITSTNFNATGLANNTTYYLHVRNKCSASSFSSWATVSFTTLNFVSCYPVTSVSLNYTSVSNAILSWASVGGSPTYEYLVNQTAGSPAGNGTPITGTSVSLSGLTGGATYYAHVRNVCQPTDKSVWFNQAFTMPLCNKPANVFVSNIVDNAADLMWSQMPNAHSYEYAVDFSSAIPTSGIITTTGFSASLTSLIPNSKYYVHLRSRCFSEDSSDWRLDSFVTKMECYAPSVEVNNLGTNNPYAFWDPIPTAIAYEYALTHMPQGPAFGTTINTTYVSLTLPADDKDYYLHVRAKCNSMFTFSDWSTVMLRTGSTGITTPGKTPGLNLYPNPAKEVLFVNGVANDVSYEIVDVTGRVQLSGKTTGAITEINTSTLPPAIYVFKLYSNDQTEIQKFIKQ